MAKRNSKQGQRDIHAMRLEMERKAREKREKKAMKNKAKQVNAMETGTISKTSKKKRLVLKTRKPGIKVKRRCEPRPVIQKMDNEG